MAQRGEKVVQNQKIPLARGTGPRYKRRVHLAAQWGWQISGEVVVPAAQSCLGIPNYPQPQTAAAVSPDTNLPNPGTFSAGEVSTPLQGGLFPDTLRSG